MSAVTFTIADGPAGRAGEARTISLLRADASMRAAVPDAERALAERALTAPRHRIAAGRWLPADLLVAGDARRPFAAMIVEGVVVHEVLLAGRWSAQLLGVGDVIRPWKTVDSALPCSMRWSSAGDAAVALLDDRFLVAARRWPELTRVLHDRLSDQLDGAARRAAYGALPRVEDRVLGLFWHLADRWGVVRPGGTVVQLSLTHELIGRMIAAKRPTVSLALSALAADGLLTRDAACAWILSHESAALLRREPDEPAGTGVSGFRGLVPGDA